MTDTPRLIEHAFPLKQASLDSVHEKNVRHGHISTLHIWPARRPLAACRAALIATLLPDPSAQPKPEGMSDDEWQKEILRRRRELCEKIGGKVVKKIERKKMPNGQIVEREKEVTEGGILHWGRETENKKLLDWFRQEIRKTYGGRAPKVLDPFAGGGAIPLEAMRLGCEATAADINPVAWFILKCTLEYPQKLAGKTHPLPDFILDNEEFMEAFYKAHPHLAGRTKWTKKQEEEYKGDLFMMVRDDPGRSPKADLGWHVRAWGQWVLDHARRDLGKYYPTYADFELPASPRSAQPGPLDKLPISREREVFFCYVLRCADGSFYIGQTDNLRRRYVEHIEGQVSWTSTHLPVELVHWEEFKTRPEALKREEEFKTGFGRKWIQREHAKKRLRVQLYSGPRLVPLREDGTPDIERLNREFMDPFAGRHEWGRPIDHSSLREMDGQTGPACATDQSKVAGRWIAKPTVAYLWARTVKCKNCRATVPLLKTLWLCKKEKKRILLTMEPNMGKTDVVFGIEANVPVKGANPAQRREHDKRIGEGTMSRSGAKCPCCATIMTMEDIRVEGKAGRLAAINTAVVADGQMGKEYRLPTEHELEMVGQTALPGKTSPGTFLLAASDRTDKEACPTIEEKIKEVFEKIPFGLPEEPLPGKEAPGFRVPLYGFDQWMKLFTPRQLMALGTLVNWTRTAGKEFYKRGYPSEWVEGITVYLAILKDKIADYNSMICTWHNSGEKIGHTFARFALPITWDYAELAVCNNVGGAFPAQLDWISRYAEHALVATTGAEEPQVRMQSAIEAMPGGYDVLLTDPPYYDAIPYSDLMDFFHVWLRRTLSGILGETDAAFRQPLSPKWNHESNDGELIDDSSRHQGDKTKSKAVYEEGMARAFQSCFQSLKNDGRLVIVFAHKHPDAWETLVSAIVRAGFVVNGSWPIQTEMGTRMRAMVSAALSSSVWLVCKKRPANARPGWDNQVLEEMRQNIRERLREYWDAGIRGPDFIWAATGPALEAYSKHPVVKKANEPGPMTVSEFLTHVRRMVVDFVVGRVLSIGKTHPDPDTRPKGEGKTVMVADEMVEPPLDNLDPVTAYYLLHRHDFGMDEAPAGACILYAISCGVSDKALADTWNLIGFTKGKSAEEAEVEETDADAEADPDAETESGSKVKLKTWVQRKGHSLGYDAPGGKPIPLIDRVHCLMHLWRSGDLNKVDEYLDANGLRRQELFKRLLQSLIELSPHASEERSLLESISNHIQARGAVREKPASLPGYET